MGVFTDAAQWKMERASGKIQRYESEVAAKQEELAGVSREADRKARLAEAIASQNASAAARGVAAFEGSPLAVMYEDTRLSEIDKERDLFQTELAKKTLIARGKIAETQAKTSANIGLIRALSNKASDAMKPGA